MNKFSYKDIYIEEGKKVLEVNILPEKYCNFDCIFCPIGRSNNKVDMPQSFDNIDDSLKDIENKIDENKIDLIFINSKGEALVNNRIEDIIKVIKNKGVDIRLLSNGYLLGKDQYMNIANTCDEVIGEIKIISEEAFKKVQRPIDGYTLKDYISNMTLFKRQYKGKFILEVTIIKGYNDTAESIETLKNIINQISPDKLLVERITDEPFKKKLGVEDDEFNKICEVLQNLKRR